MERGQRRWSEGGRRGRGRRGVFLFREWRVQRPFVKGLVEGGKLTWKAQARKLVVCDSRPDWSDIWGQLNAALESYWMKGQDGKVTYV